MTINTPLPNSKTPHFQNEAKCKTCLVKMNICYFAIFTRERSQKGESVVSFAREQNIICSETDLAKQLSTVGRHCA